MIAHFDRGVPNWLDTAGHREGMIFYLGSARDLLLGDSRPEQALGKFF